MKLKIKAWAGKNKWYILAFVIPFVVAVAAYICQGLWPFGDRGVSIIDSYHQYVPFFSELQYKWRNFDSLMYSWNGGLGMNFWAVVAYYLASPLNILLLIFPKSMVMECFAFIYFIKIGLAGMTFSIFIGRRFEHYGPAVSVFGCCYALSSFIVGYGWNIMWLDCIVLFPIVMLGIYRLVKTGKGWLYGASLALCIFTNYYISIMICLFVCIYFLAELSFNKKEWLGEKVRRLFRFAGYSLMAGGFGAVMLMPTAYTLMSSQSASSTFPSTLKFYHNIFEILCQHFTAVVPTCLSGNFNLYCGGAMMVLVPVYLLNRKTRIWEKLIRLLIAAFLLVSLNTNFLTYIWHGFHFPNGLPGRFSFIYIFVILMMAYEGFLNRKYCPKWVPFLASGLWLGFLFYCWRSGKVELEIYTWGINIAILIVYGILLTVICCVKKKRKLAEITLLAIVLLEACGYGAFGFCMNGTVNRKDYYSDQKSVAALKKEISDREGDDFYRIELEERRGRDDITWHNLPGMSLFSSTVNAGVDNLVRRLGFYAVTNKYSYQGATPETDAFFNIKYLLSNIEQDNIRTFEWLDTNDGKNLYQNYCALGMGFMVSEDILQWDYEKTNPFDVINHMTTLCTGLDSQPYHYFGLPEPTAEGCDLTTDSWADWSYTATDGGDGTVTYTYTPDAYQDLYIYFKATHCKKLEVVTPSGKKSYSDEDGHIVHLGSLNGGDRITLVFHLDDEYDNGSIKLIAGEHHMDAFYQIFDTLKNGRFVTEHVSSTRISGTIRAEEKGIMFTSIPYEKGWTVKVDGEKVTPEKIGGAFIGIPLSAGEHSIAMNYRPEGFVPGLIITCISGALFVVFGKKEKKHSEVFEEPENPEQQED